MCGIFGFNSEDKNMLIKMSKLLQHRGPDDTGYFTDKEISVGMTRLSIIDLKSGNQPQHNENSDIWIVFNGEIYNFKELRDILEKKGHNFYTQSDTEVIIHSYEEWGELCLNKLRGQFAFCIYDSRKKVLFLARDHLGLKPLYYYWFDNLFIFGSEIKCFFPHQIKKNLNLKSFNLYLSFNYVPFELTLFKNIYKIPPSHYLIFNLKQKSFYLKKYWKFDFKINNSLNVSQTAKTLKMLIEDSIKLRLISDVPIGAFLSGGIDSTTVVAIMNSLVDDPVKTFSISFEEGAPINESKYSKFVANYFNTEHKELKIKSSSYELLPKLIWHLDDLIADAAIIPIYIMANYSKERITVALTGDGADEIFGGYFIYYKPNKSKLRLNLPDQIFKLLNKNYSHIPLDIIKRIISYLYSSKNNYNTFLRNILHIMDYEKNQILPFKFDEISYVIKDYYNKRYDLVKQYINWDIRYQLPNKYNMKVDKMTMAASLEARIPFLDKKIVEFASSLPNRLKLKGDIEKYILRLAVKDYVPSIILKRQKLGFGTPINLWLGRDFNEASDILLERLSKRKKIIRTNYVNKIRKFKAVRRFENKVWNLLCFELWFETFLENDGFSPINYVQ